MKILVAINPQLCAAAHNGGFIAASILILAPAGSGMESGFAWLLERKIVGEMLATDSGTCLSGLQSVSPEPAVWRKIISVMLLMVFMMASTILIWLPSIFSHASQAEHLPTSEYIKLAVYGVLILAIGLLSVWGAACLNRRWRSALGIICVVFGLGNLMTILRRMLDGDSFRKVLTDPNGNLLLPYAAILIPIGIALILYQKHLDRRRELR
jgi:hypothetical protein